MAVVTATTEEDCQHQDEAVTSEDDDGSEEWSCQCARSASTDGKSAQDQPSDGEHGKIETGIDETFHEDTQSHRAGDAELLFQSFPAGTTTPPLDVMRHDATPQVSLSFDSPLPDEPVAKELAEPRESTPDLHHEPEPDSAGRKSLKRKASEELTRRDRKS